MGSNEHFLKLVKHMQNVLEDVEEPEEELRPLEPPVKEVGQLKIQRDRCPFCHDDIMPGGENRPCSECLAWHHTECWDQHGKCVGCGDAWIDHGNGHSSAPLPAALTRKNGVVKEHRAIQRAEKCPQKEPVCAHRFNPMDNRCDYCHETLEVHAAKEFGSTFLPREDMASYPITNGDMRRLGIPSEADETVVCGNQGCDEPTARCLVVCSLCHADGDCGFDPCSHGNEITAHQKRVNDIRRRDKAKQEQRAFQIFCALTILVMLLFALGTHLKQGGM